MHDLDKSLSVRFYLKPKENARKSKEEGRPIYEDVEMVSIMAPGNTKTDMCAPAHEVHYNSNVGEQQTYADRFHEHYAEFKRGVEEQMVGTPISELTSLMPSQRAEMQSKNIRTVEQLAGMSDANIRKMGPNFRAHVDMAKGYLDKTGSNSGMAAEIEELRKKVAELQGAQIEGNDSEDTMGDDLESYEIEDLKNMIRDAGGDVPRGNVGKPRLIEVLRELAKEAA